MPVNPSWTNNVLRSLLHNPEDQTKAECRLPSNQDVKAMILEAKRFLFPRHFGKTPHRLSRIGFRNRLALHRFRRLVRRLIASVLLYQEGKRHCREVFVKADRIAAQYCEQLPSIRSLALLDLDAHYEGDPAAESKDLILLAYPGFYALLIHRLAHPLFVQNIPVLPRMMAEFAHRETGIDIHPGATIGHSLMIDHGTGVVIGETARIGNRVKLYQGVTLGALSTSNGRSMKGTLRHPSIEDNVTIYAGASILGGDTVIGHNSVVGSNAFITTSIPPHSKAMTPQGDLIVKKRKEPNA